MKFPLMVALSKSTSLVSRKVFAEVPPGVEYRLTPLGHNFVVPASALIDWMVANWPEIERERANYDKKLVK